MGEGQVEVAAAVFQLAAQHLLGDGQKVDDGVVVDAPALGHAARAARKAVRAFSASASSPSTEWATPLA
jgi:hypothetical protein